MSQSVNTCTSFAELFNGFKLILTQLRCCDQRRSAWDQVDLRRFTPLLDQLPRPAQALALLLEGAAAAFPNLPTGKRKPYASSHGEGLD